MLRARPPPAARRTPRVLPRFAQRVTMARMDAANTPTAARHCTRVPHASRSVFLIRCSVPDLHLLSDFCDGTLGRDYFFKRRHLQSILERPTNAVFAIEVDRQMAGMVIVYKSTVLDNLYLSPEFRVDGIGTAILDVIRPLRIRSKTNMLAGDPTAFYEKNGYVKDIADPRRPHIIDMVRDTETPIGRRASGVAHHFQPLRRRAGGR